MPDSSIMETIDMPISSVVPPRFSGRDFTLSDYREIIDELLQRTDERRFRYGLRREGAYPFAEFFAVPDAAGRPEERLVLLQGTVEVFCDTEDDGPGASYFGAPAWRGVVRLDSWECRQMPAALEAYRDERVFLQWPVAVCDFDPTQVDGAEDYFD